MMGSDLEILDTTLRDGSYVIDFQFTAEDTALIASVLESAGIGLIEIAHGLGLGAAREGHGDQPSSDAEYLQAAAGVLRKARFGTFFIPGIGREDDVRLAADLGAHFVRVGTDVTDMDAGETYVKLAKELGLTVFCNLMKSYAVSPETFGQCGRKAQEFGADVLCLVDSAGGMLPQDVRLYLAAARDACTLALGFHGHNNLSMAVANSIEAYEAGAGILDASLQGMGRSEGNAMTEILVAVLQKRGLLEDVDVNGLLDASEAFIRPLLHNTGYSGLGITAGRAQFHSSFLGNVMAASRRHGVDARDLILRLCEKDKVNAPDDLVESLALELAQAGPRSKAPFAITTAAQPTDGGLLAQVRGRALELKEKARKSGLPSVFNVVVGPHEETHVSPFVETGFGCALSNVMLADVGLLGDVLRAVDGAVDYVLLDGGANPQPFPKLEKSALLAYVDHEMWARATVSHVSRLLGGAVVGRTLAVVGVAPLAQCAARLFAQSGAVVLLDVEGVGVGGASDGAAPIEGVEACPLGDAASKVDAVIALSPRVPCVGPSVVNAMGEDALLYDGGIGSLEAEAVEAAEARLMLVVRVDMRPTLAATALELIRMRQIVEEHMGRETWDGVAVVAGGLMGHEGDVIVDNIRNPTRVIGIADGRGGISDGGGAEESVRKVQKVRKTIAGKQLDQQLTDPSSG